MTLLAGATDVVPAEAPRPNPAPPSRGAALMRALAAPLLIAVVVQNAGNLILHAVLGRFLTADQYGALGTLLSLMILLTVPLSALQAAASKGAAVGPSTKAAQRRSVRTLVISAVLVTVVVTAMAPLPTALFHLESTTDALLLGPFVGVSIALAVVRGRLLGLDQRRGIRAVAATFVISTAVRLAIAFATLSTLGTTGAIVATLVGECLALGYGVIALRPTTAASAAAPGPHPWLTASDMGWSSLAIGGLFLFTTIDLFLARHFLSGAASGGYVAAATIGKTLLALPAAALAAAYPRHGRSRTRPGTPARAAAHRHRGRRAGPRWPPSSSQPSRSWCSTCSTGTPSTARPTSFGSSPSSPASARSSASPPTRCWRSAPG